MYYHLNNFGPRLRALVEGRGTIEQAYAEIGVSRATLFNWFDRDTPPPGKEKLLKLRHYLGSDAAWILDAVQEKCPVVEPAGKEAVRNAQFKEYLDFLRACRVEAERLGQGDQAKTADLFDKMLAVSMHFQANQESVEERVKRMLPAVLTKQDDKTIPQPGERKSHGGGA